MTLAGHRGIIVIQPRMTGGFWLRRARATRPHPPGVPRGQTPSDGLVLRHAAAGQDRLVPGRSQAAARPSRSSHGPDALEIGRDELAERLARTARGIKPTLMDQKVLAGIGNIYADEILHHARIHPERGAGTLSPGELEPAAPGDRRDPDDGDRAGGLELRRRLSNGPGPRRGLPGPEFRLRPREPALPGVRQPIMKTRIAGLIGRPTYYCPRCQTGR